MKKLFWLFLLLHVSAAQASIGSALLWPLQAFYNGPYTSVVGFTSRVKAQSIALPEEHIAEVHEVLSEMGVDPSTITLRMLNGRKRYINDYHSSGTVVLNDRVEAVGGILVFDKNFFLTIPKGQRRAEIGREVWHIMHLNDLKTTLTVLGTGLITGLTCGLGIGLTEYYDHYSIYSRTELHAKVKEVGTVVGIVCGVFGLFLGWVYVQPRINRSRVKTADIYAAKVLGCAQDAIDYHWAQLQKNNSVCDHFPEVYEITTHDGIEVGRRRIKPAEVYDTKGNCKVDSGNPPLTDRIAYLKELTAA